MPNPLLERMDDAALLTDITGPLAMSTRFLHCHTAACRWQDGSLAVHGTVNDVAMLGARPRYLSCGFILEEGLPLETLERVVADMGAAAREAGVSIVTGDTRAVPRGACDKIFINTTGIGQIFVFARAPWHNARPGDAVLVSVPWATTGLRSWRRYGLSSYGCGL